MISDKCRRALTFGNLAFCKSTFQKSRPYGRWSTECRPSGWNGNSLFGNGCLVNCLIYSCRLTLTFRFTLTLAIPPVLPFCHGFSLYTGLSTYQIIHPKKYTAWDSLETNAHLSINKIFLDGKKKYKSKPNANDAVSVQKHLYGLWMKFPGGWDITRIAWISTFYNNMLHKSPRMSSSLGFLLACLLQIMTP